MSPFTVHSYTMQPGSRSLVSAIALSATARNRSGVWDISTWSPVQASPRDAEGFLAVTFTNDFDAVAIGPASEGIAHFDLETGELSAFATGTVAPGGVYHDSGLEYTEAGRLLVAAGADGANLIYAATGQLLGQRFPTDELVKSAADGGGFVVTGSQDLLLVWNLDPDAPPDIACHASGRNLTLEEWGQSAGSITECRSICSTCGQGALWPCGGCDTVVLR